MAVTRMRTRGGALDQRGERAGGSRDPAAGYLLCSQARAQGVYRHAADGTRGRGRADLRDAGEARQHRHAFLREGEDVSRRRAATVPPVYAPEIVADVILRRANRPLREFIAGGAGRKLIRRRDSFLALADVSWSDGRSIPADGQPANGPTTCTGPLPTTAANEDGTGRDTPGDQVYTRTFLHPREATLIAGLAAILAAVAIRRGSRTAIRPDHLRPR